MIKFSSERYIFSSLDCIAAGIAGVAIGVVVAVPGASVAIADGPRRDDYIPFHRPFQVLVLKGQNKLTTYPDDD